MNSKITCLLALAAVMFGAISCSDDPNKPQEPIIDPVETLNGIYVVNNGVQSTSQPGSLTVYDYVTGTATQNAFATKNGISLGDTAEDVLLYGSKLYVSVTESNLVWVINPNTMEKIASIVPETGTEQPRFMAAKDGKVYVSLYSGHLARIDTLTLRIDRTIALGPNPEKIAISGNKLYSANSDGLNWMNGYTNSSMSEVNLSDMSCVNYQVGLNPNGVATDGENIFVLCMGNYADVPATVKRFRDGQVYDVCPGSIMTVAGGELYVIDAPWGGTPTYKVYSSSTDAFLREMVIEGPLSPCAMAVEKTRGDIVILSRTINSEGTVQYTEPAEGYLYGHDGVLRDIFPVGINPTAACFRY